ncbi:glycoside hydrolase family 43 protein [Cellulomonas soli]
MGLPDLLTWSPPRAVTVAPEDAGMAWAPESVYDPISGDYLVHWASSLSDTGDPARRGEGPARILVSRTRDFRTFTEPTTYLERPGGVIDLTVLVTADGVHRFAKQDDDVADSWHVFHQKGASFDDPHVRTVARHIGQEIAPRVEAPLIFKANDAARWYLWVDQYARQPQGYQALTTTDLDSGEWTLVPPQDFHLPPNTKHGAVLPLLRREYEALDERW